MPVLVSPLRLLALRVLGVVAINMMVEPAQISVRYSLSVAAVSLAALCGVMDVSLLVRVADFALCTFWVRVLEVVAPVVLWRSGGLSLAMAAGWVVVGRWCRGRIWRVPSGVRRILVRGVWWYRRSGVSSGRSGLLQGCAVLLVFGILVGCSCAPAVLYIWPFSSCGDRASV